MDKIIDFLAEGIKKFCLVAFNWWALLLALILFLPLGFLAGYEVKQPSLNVASTKSLLSVIDKIEGQIAAAEARGAGASADSLAKLQPVRTDLEAIKNTANRLPVSNRAELTTKINIALDDMDSLKAAAFVRESKFDEELAGDLRELRSLRKQIYNGANASKDFPSILYDQFCRFLKWVGAVGFLGIITLLLFLTIWTSNPAFRAAIARTGSVTAFGVTVNFSDLQSVRASIIARDSALDKDIILAYTSTLKRSKLNEQFQKLIEDIKNALLATGVDLSQVKYRATLFVPGFVGQELIQATRYTGTWQERLGDERVVGRRFSVRFGIIGKAWRLQTSQYFPSVDNNEKSLLREWGFTQEETTPHTSSASPTTGCLMAFSINDIGNAPPLGIIYLEADGPNKFHPANPAGNQSAAMTLVGDQSGMTKADKFADNEIWKKLPAASVQKLKDQLIRLQAQLRWNDKINDGVGR